jgi:hypothetical protein
VQDEPIIVGRDRDALFFEKKAVPAHDRKQ